MYGGITEEKLDKLGIYDLRRVARLCGVSSPTSKRRDVLINEILRIQAGELKPIFNNKIGRPVKSFGEDSDLKASLVIRGDKELEEHIKPEKIDESFLVLEQDFSQDDLPVNANTVEFKGILRKTQQGNFYALSTMKLKTKTYVLFDEDDVEEHNLLEGDLIHGTAFVYPNKGYAKIKEINEVNGIKNSENKYDLDFEPIIPNVVLEQPDFKAGQTKVCMCDNLVKQIEFISSRTAKFTSQGYKCVVLALEISIETKLRLDRISGLTQVVSLLDDTSKFSFDKINDFLNHANSLFYHNNNVIVFVLDALGIFSILDTVYQSKMGIHNEKTSLYIRKLLANSKTSKNGSISTYCLYSEDEGEINQREVNMLQKYSIS